MGHLEVADIFVQLIYYRGITRTTIRAQDIACDVTFISQRASDNTTIFHTWRNVRHVLFTFHDLMGTGEYIVYYFRIDSETYYSLLHLLLLNTCLRTQFILARSTKYFSSSCSY